MSFFDEKVAIVTGAAKRGGACIAKTLHRAGFNVVLHYRRSQAEAVALCTALNKTRLHSAVVVEADLCDRSSYAQIVDMALGSFGRIDVLVNNASSFFPTPFFTVSQEAWDTIIDANLRGAYFLSKIAAPHLIETDGAIVNIADIYAERALAFHSIYTIAKAGMVAMTRALAVELAPSVRVNAVSPGAIEWPQNSLSFDEKERERILSTIPLGRLGSFEDVADTVLFLTEAQYITGQNINVDGGRSVFL